jgi:hypothetical protein
MASQTLTRNHQALLAKYRFNHPDTAAKVRAAAVDGDADALKADISAALSKEAYENARDGVRVPPGMPAVDHDSWKDVVVETAVNKENTSLAERLPASNEGWQRAGDSAAKALPGAVEVRDMHEVDADALTEQRDAVLNQHRPRPEIEREIRQTGALRKIMVAVEILSAFVTGIVVYKLSSYPSFGTIPFAIWMEFFGFSIIAVVMVLFAPMAVRHGLKLAGWTGRNWTLAVLTVLVWILFLVAFAILRWAGLSGLDAGQWSELAMGSFAATPIFVIGGLAEYALHRRETSEKELDALNAALAPYDRDLAKQRTKILSQEAVIGGLQETITLADRVEAMFEREVAATRARLDNALRAANEEADRASSALSRIQSELTRPERVRFQRAGAAAAALIGALITGPLSGCSGELPPPDHVIIVCDGTGVVPACTRRTLQQAVDDRFGSGTPIEGGMVIVFGTAGDPSEVTSPLQTPPLPRAYGRDRDRADEWLTEVKASFDDFSIPVDTPDNRHTNRSDIVGTILVAMEYANNLRGNKELIIMTDGQQIGGGIDLVRGRGDSADALARMEEIASTQPSTGGWGSSLTSAEVCGITHVGIDEGVRSEVRGFWSELLASSGAIDTKVSSACITPAAHVSASP